MDKSTNDNLRSKESEKSIMQNIILKGIVMEQYVILTIEIKCNFNDRNKV